MSKRQRRHSTADPPYNGETHIIDFFYQNTAETNDGIVEPVCCADPGGSDVQLQHHELSSPDCDECSDKQAVKM